MIIFPTGLIEWSMIASQLPPEKAVKFQRFVRRFTLAYWFDGLKVKNLDKHTIEGYDALFSVFLSFTAYELLWDGLLSYYDEEILIEEKQNFSIENPALANRLKHDKKLEAFLHMEDKTNPLTQKVELFFNSDNADFLPLLAAIKDKVMHGYFSIGTMKAESKEHSVDIWDASRELLVVTEDLFHNFVLMET